MPHVFIDFDDTLSDYNAFIPAYIAKLASITSLEMGGRVEHWESAMGPALSAAIGRYVDRFRGKPLAGYNAWLREERARIMADTLARAGREPLDAESAHDLALHLQDRGLRPSNHLFEGADSALRALASAGFRLHFASSQESRYLRSAMTGLPSLHHIERFYGPDLIDCAKEGPEYYERVFAGARVEPEDCVVVDDLVECLEWAAGVGARVIQARVKGDPDPVSEFRSFESWSEVPAILESLFRKVS